MGIPSAKRVREWLTDHYRLDPSATTIIRDAMRKGDQASSVRTLDSALELINRVLNGHGIEALWGEDAYNSPEAVYVNMGDTYAPTVLYDIDRGKFHVTTWGDFVESQERRGRRFR